MTANGTGRPERHGGGSDIESAVSEFASVVGSSGPVAAVGGGSQGDLGGALQTGTLLVNAPVGDIEHHRDELTVHVTAGTTVAELEEALNAAGQSSGFALPLMDTSSTIGSCVAVGRGGVQGLRFGHIRDSVLGIDAVDAAGRVVSAGGATVKNVSGFDLCRLVTGSLGTLLLIGALTLRTRPLARTTRWVVSDAAPSILCNLGDTITSVLWNGHLSWVQIAGHSSDVEHTLRRLESLGDLEAADTPPQLPRHRWSVDPGHLSNWRKGPPVAMEWMAEVGVGIVHASVPQPPRPLADRTLTLHRAVKDRFDPYGRLAPGRSTVASAAGPS